MNDRASLSHDLSDEKTQREITRAISLAGQLLLQHGAESKIVFDICERLGLALGLTSVELSLSANSLVITCISQHHCMTTTRRSPDRGIHMGVVLAVQQVLLETETQHCPPAQVMRSLEAIYPKRYPALLLSIVVGLSCGSFSQLSGGDAGVFAVTFVASGIAMMLRLWIASLQFNPFLNFAVTAFVATAISALGVILEIGNSPRLAMASSVLFLVPGFPLINAVSDMVKGFTNMGIARWTVASLLILSTALGIAGAMSLTGVWG